LPKHSNTSISQKDVKQSSFLKWLILFLILLMGGGAFWYFGKSFMGYSPVKYITTPVEEGPLIATIRASGTLNPVRSVTVGTGVSGMIRELTVDFNDRVKQGQVIAKIDQREFQAKYDQALANYELALKNHQYNEKLMQQGFISEQALITTESALRAAVGALNLAKKSLDDTLIRSPVDGVVVKRSVEVGQTVASSLQSPEIFIIARNLAEMQVETSIDESDVGRIEEGQEATFTVDAFPGRIFKGKVKQIRKAPVNIQNVVTYTVLISADNPDFKLLPGMTANARIVVEEKEKTLKIPNTALRFRMPIDKNAKPSSPPQAKDAPKPPSRPSGSGMGMSNYRSVYILEGDEKSAKPVKKAFRLGLSDGEYSEILPLKKDQANELKVGDQVIVGIEGSGNKPDAATPPRGGPRMF
jgi:HlyD family secretion protein